MTWALGIFGRWSTTLTAALVALVIALPIVGCTPTPPANGGSDSEEGGRKTTRGGRGGTRGTSRGRSRGSTRGSGRRSAGREDTAKGDETGSQPKDGNGVSETPKDPTPKDPTPKDPTPNDPGAAAGSPALLAKIADLEEQLQSKDGEIATLNGQVESLQARAGGDEAVQEQMDKLAQQRDEARGEIVEAGTRLQEERDAHQREVEALQARLDAAGGKGFGGQDVPGLLTKIEDLETERDGLSQQLSGAQRIKKSQIKQIDTLIAEKDKAVKDFKAAEADKDKAELDVAKLMSERDQLTADNDELRAGASEAQDKLRGEMGRLEEKVVNAGEIATDASKAAGAAKATADKVARKQQAALTAGVIGLFLGLAALGLAVWLMRENKGMKYQLAFQHAQGGGVDPAELDSIVTSRVQEVANSLGGGADPDQIRALLGAELQSEAFHNRLKSMVTDNAKAAGDGGGGEGGGGGLSPEDVKIMVDNQFRAITTYLKNEAVPKMVEDALKRLGDA